jgi:hypothetical protein
MLNGFFWHLWCDHTLTTGSPLDHKYLATYIQLGQSAITAALAYLGAAIPVRFCLNFVHDFNVTNGWPTDAVHFGIQSFLLHDFEHLPTLL